VLTWENRVVMCRECHREYHKKGVNPKAIAALKEIRKEFLLSMGRAEYVDYVAPVEELDANTQTV
jgi:hypothetical protein